MKKVYLFFLVGIALLIGVVVLIQVRLSSGKIFSRAISDADILHGKEDVLHPAMTSAEAGISETGDMHSENLAYLKGIEKKEGKTFITIDPVIWVDCWAQVAVYRPEPEGCKNNLAGFFIENSDTSTRTLELAENAGPFFITTSSGEAGQWKTMDFATMQGLLKGTTPWEPLAPEYYNPILSGRGGTTSLASDVAPFHVTVEEGKAVKVVQKYLP
jgi:hypothetical protein